MATQMSDRLQDLLTDFDAAMLVTRTADGHLRSRPMALADIEHDGTGWTTDTSSPKLIHAGPDFLRWSGHEYNGLRLASLLDWLASKVKKNAASLAKYQRPQSAAADIKPAAAGETLLLKEFVRQVQGLVDSHTDIVLETGDSWLTAQEISTMIRHGANPIIFLINNHGYTIEVEIHDGPYNNIKNWDYAGLVDVFNAGDGNGLGLRANTAGELATAIQKAKTHPGLVLIECTLDRDDCSAELVEWGRRVAAANSRV